MRLPTGANRRLMAASLFLALLVLGGVESSRAQPSNGSSSPGRDETAVAEAIQGWWTASMKTHNQRIAWFRESEFGCFIHWGVYSTFGGEWNGKPFRGYAEHMMRSQKIPRAEYVEKVVSGFNPVKFDAEEWVRLIKAAGMKYVIITAKHHDGFAMYPSSVSRYNIRDATPFKRDPMGELAAAARKHGLRFGFYYSHAFDWEHPDAPGNDWDYNNPAGDKGLHGGLTWYDKHPDLLDKARKYVDEKAIPQIVELVKKYQPDILWFDTPSKIPLSENLRIMKAVREFAPNVVINGRLARGLDHSFGDYKNTGDRAAEMVPTDGDWETIPTTNESYGYHKHDQSHKPVSHFIQLMAKAAARGGNLLMNIGPMGDGQIDQKDQQILLGIGKWLKVNGKSIYRTERTPLPVQSWGESTRQGNTLYLHVFHWPSDGKLVVGGLKSSVTKAYLLAAPQKSLKTARLNANDIAIEVPVGASLRGRPSVTDAADTVIAVEVKGEIRTNPVRLLASMGQTNVLRVFDGELHGKGLRFGDGKAPRAYVFEWKTPTQWVGWKVRVIEASEFEVSLKYTTNSTANRGSYAVTIGDQVLKNKVDPTASESESKTVVLGRVKLRPGDYEVAVKPTDIQGGELMRPFYLALTPVETKQ
ncbi:MAG: alpha-L-fucosidase [Acidobacteriota bacterium]